jgi:hypothetical protein
MKKINVCLPRCKILAPWTSNGTPLTLGIN